jgi:DNA-binding transcriptional ArsR family regulator
MNADSMDLVFHALAHAGRRKIIDIVKSNPGSNVNDVCEHFDVSRIAVMKHINLLEEAGLIVSEREGRARRLYFNVVPIQLIHDRWSDEFSGWWAGRLADIKYRVERSAADRDDETP